MQRILLIESSPTQKHALEKSIKSHGYSVNALSNFSEAETHLSKVKEIGTYDAIVMAGPEKLYNRRTNFLQR